MDANEFVDGMFDGDNAGDKEAAVTALLDYWQAIRDVVPEKLRFTDKDRADLESSRVFFETGPGSRRAPWERGERVDMAAEIEAEIAELDRRREAWAVICALLDGAALPETEIEGLYLEPFLEILWGPSEAPANLPEYRAYIERCWLPYLAPEWAKQRNR